ncbi:c-type heme family protein [Polaribacter atrinae]|uniref:Cytochrome c family protein n=1 Tax=Polaribacter atrinae TaxID=1333662 RepID=A0A176TFE3_9FLAO|nr:DUF3365 domain-containing protein [Polaribacter atrinae]OAD46554.1 cytochrome c family protein [Polaribacter atrinae]
MKLLTLFIAVSFMFGCKDAKKSPTYSKKSVSETQEHIGKKLMETNCYVCHNATTPEDNRIAPPMIAIKKRYLMENTTKAAFIASMQNWIENPTRENAIMYGAVERFGLMPKQAFPKETIQQIADYMFVSEIEKPTWFEEHYNQQFGNGGGNGKRMQRQQQGINLKKLSYSEKGLKYALATKSVLGKNLMGTIQKKGTLEALKFCNIKADPLTDSMSIMYKATIKRVSDKPRNVNNTANILEKGYIAVFKKEVQLNKESEPIVVESAENVKFYYPIKTNSMCLQCHGTPTSDIKNTTLAEIDKLYPDDLAVGYTENQVRGIWSITFHK